MNTMGTFHGPLEFDALASAFAWAVVAALLIILVLSWAA